MFHDSRTGRDSILIAAPIVARGEFMGVVSGVASLQGPLVSAMFSELLDVAPGHEGFTYLVDGSGRSIFHDRDDLLGADLKAYFPVGEVTAGASGADLSTSPTGEYVHIRLRARARHKLGSGHRAALVRGGRPDPKL